ncbi:MAG: hypothetical protein Q9220_002645 [cf. Caloplaca sp. 1 TL-2023]
MPNSAAAIDASPKVTAKTIKEQLSDCLSSWEYVGEVMSSQTSQLNVDPGLCINGIGDVSLPLRTSDAALILKHSKQAPFGRGTETVVDTSFRATQQFDPDSFQLRNPAWEQHVRGIGETLSQSLGVQDASSNVKAELYKLLLYKEGDMFRPHKDSEKAEGMFATMVICLPSLHEGGELVLTHHGTEYVVKSEEASEFGQTHIAWYSDVVHEIKPVTRGYRLVLTYNLIRKAGPGMSAAAIVHERVMLEDILRTWQTCYKEDSAPNKKLIYMLQHDYSEASLRLDGLKGHDRLMGQNLQESCEKEKFTILLAHLTSTVHDAVGEDRDCDPCKHLTLTGVVDLEGRLRRMLKKIQVSKEDIVQLTPFNRSPNEVTAEETGNEGVQVTHFYRESVLILMPSAFFIEFRLKNSHSRYTVRWIENLFVRVKSKSEQSVRDEKLARICTLEAGAFAKAAGWKKEERIPIMAKCIKACQILRDRRLLDQCVQGCYQYPVGPDVYKALIDTLHTFEFDDIRSSLDKFASEKAASVICQLEMLATSSFEYYSTRSSEQPLPQWSTFEAWAKSAIKQILDGVVGLDYGYIDHLVKLIISHDEDFSVNIILPWLNQHTLTTPSVIGFLAELSIIIHREELPFSVIDPFLASLLKPTISKLSLDDLPPSAPKVTPYWWAHDLRYQRHVVYESRLGEQISHLYCLCRTKEYAAEASTILSWLVRESQDAHMNVFPTVLLPFLRTIGSVLKDHGLNMPTEVQSDSVSITRNLVDRSLTPEPKTKDWKRGRTDCPHPNCIFCSTFNPFLEDPETKEATFSEKHYAHLRNDYKCKFEGDWQSVESSYKFVKHAEAYEVKGKHASWQRGIDVMHKLLPSEDALKELYGGEYEEMMGLLHVKVSS